MSTENTEVSTEQPSSTGGNFRESLPEEYRNEASLADFKDLGGLVKSYVNSQKMLGSSIRIPSEDSSPEAREEFFKKVESTGQLVRKPNPDDANAMSSFYNSLGRPEDPSKYELDPIEGIEFNPEALSEFNKVAHEAGLTSQQYKKVIGMYANEVMEKGQAEEQRYSEFENQVKQMWGNEFKAKIDAAATVRDVYYDKYPEAMQDLLSGPNAANPALLSMMAELAGSFKEQGTIGGNTKHQFGISPEEAREKISEIRSNKDHPYWKSDKDAVARMEKLYSIAYK